MSYPVSSITGTSSSLTGSVITGTQVGSLIQDYTPRNSQVNKMAEGKTQSMIIKDDLAKNMMKSLIREYYPFDYQRIYNLVYENQI